MERGQWCGTLTAHPAVPRCRLRDGGRRGAPPAKRRADSASPRRREPASGRLGACRPHRGEIRRATPCQTFNARVERGASRVPVERVPYFVDLALAVFKEVRHSSGCLPAEKFPTFASRRQGRERVALLDFRRRFHLTRLRDVAQEESPA